MPAAPRQEIVGRGVSEGARLFREWFESLGAAAERGEPAAYVFVMGSLVELLRAFDIHVVFPEINSLQTAVRRVAHEFLGEAEDYGYSPDICGYVKADVGMQLRRGAHPMGRIPPPSLAIATNACNTYVKWAEIWERLYHIPVFTLDVPGRRVEDRLAAVDVTADREYVRHQIRELIALCERVSGRRLDLDRLRETLGYANDMTRSWRRILALNSAVPAPVNAVSDGTVYLGVANGLRGTAAGAAYFRDLVEELEYKVAHGIGAVADERYRLVFVGVPCYPIFRRFTEMFTEWGGSFVGSTYLWFASGGTSIGFEYDLANPIDSLADGVLASVRHAMDSMFYPDRALESILDDYRVDGIVYHAVKSCRTTSTGLADCRRALMARRDVASLFLEADMMDKRVVSEAQLKNRIDAFFEGLASRRQTAAAAAAEKGTGTISPP